MGGDYRCSAEHGVNVPGDRAGLRLRSSLVVFREVVLITLPPDNRPGQASRMLVQVSRLERGIRELVFLVSAWCGVHAAVLNDLAVHRLWLDLAASGASHKMGYLLLVFSCSATLECWRVGYRAHASQCRGELLATCCGR